MEVSILKEIKKDSVDSIEKEKSMNLNLSDALSPNLHTDACYNSSMGQSDAEKGSSPRVMRSACDFCHAKRIKCRRDDVISNGGRCQQCEKRNISCNFSLKEKTGPKPKVSKNNIKEASAVRSEKISEGQTLDVKSEQVDPTDQNNSTQLSATSPLESISVVSKSTNLQKQEGNIVKVKEEIYDSCNFFPENVLLSTYLSTISKFLPFCNEAHLIEALRIRESAEDPSTVKSSLAQAQLAGALAIGALIRNSPIAEQYHIAARAQLKTLFNSPNSDAGSVLCMLAFYWQYKGDDDKKSVYLKHMKIGIAMDRSALTLELNLCMEHLDYEVSGCPSSIPMSIPPRLKALHVVSCVLTDIQELMEPSTGPLPASTYCSKLLDCSLNLNVSNGEALPLLLCSSLHAFLLVMLGRGPDAISILNRLPSYLETCPDAPKALPLSWDASLIGATLSFLLNLKLTYSSLYDAVTAAQNLTSATKWTCKLPAVDSTPDDYLNHNCESTSNICSIICQVGNKTKCGIQSFYIDTGSNVENPSMLVPYIVPGIAKDSVQQSCQTGNQQVFYQSLQPLSTHIDAYSNSFKILQSRQRRTHFDMKGLCEVDGDCQDLRRPLTLNNNQASPVPFTPKRIRNSQCNTPSLGSSPVWFIHNTSNGKVDSTLKSDDNANSDNHNQRIVSVRSNQSPPQLGSPQVSIENPVNIFASELVPIVSIPDDSNVKPYHLRSSQRFNHTSDKVNHQNIEQNLSRFYTISSKFRNYGDECGSTATDVNNKVEKEVSSNVQFRHEAGHIWNEPSYSIDQMKSSASLVSDVKNYLGGCKKKQQCDLLNNVNGSGIFSTLGICNEPNTSSIDLLTSTPTAPLSKAESYCSPSSIHSNNESSYLNYMNDNELLGVLEEWSNIENDELFSFNDGTVDGTKLQRSSAATSTSSALSG